MGGKGAEKTIPQYYSHNPRTLAMPNPDYQRFAISIPSPMATQIDEACKVDGRNPSEFFCEAVRFYMNASQPPQAPQWVMPGNEEEHQGNSLGLFRERLHE